jgi:endonuclease YncB( thermonuclease family)
VAPGRFPESRQPFGRASKQHLAELLANREDVAKCSKIDRYPREVCHVLVGGADAGLEQVRAGLAWFFGRYAKELPPDRRQQYAEMEAQAKGESTRTATATFTGCKQSEFCCRFRCRKPGIGIGADHR